MSRKDRKKASASESCEVVFLRAPEIGGSNQEPTRTCFSREECHRNDGTFLYWSASCSPTGKELLVFSNASFCDCGRDIGTLVRRVFFKGGRLHTPSGGGEFVSLSIDPGNFFWDNGDGHLSFRETPERFQKRIDEILSNLP